MTNGNIWTLPTAFLTGTAAAGGIALINSIGNIGGFAGPYAVGYLRDATGSTTAGLVVLAGAYIAAGIVTLLVGHDRKVEVVGGAVSPR